MRYDEETILKEIEEYILSTYGEHYVGKGQFQIQDLLHSIDIAVPFCQANAIKYLARYGKKKGRNRLDLLKAVHYTILLMHFSADAEPVEEKEHTKEFWDGIKEYFDRFPEQDENGTLTEDLRTFLDNNLHKKD